MKRKLRKVPKDWTGSVKYNPKGSSIPMSFDYAADPKSEIPLLPPTLDGYKFTGWTPSGVIPAGTKEALTFTATFEPKKPSSLMILFRSR